MHLKVQKSVLIISPTVVNVVYRIHVCPLWCKDTEFCRQEFAVGVSLKIYASCLRAVALNKGIMWKTWQISNKQCSLHDIIAVRVKPVCDSSFHFAMKCILPFILLIQASLIFLVSCLVLGQAKYRGCRIGILRNVRVTGEPHIYVTLYIQGERDGTSSS